jgi:hypothetical protein
VGATTRSGLLSAPLRSRFGSSLRLDFYDVGDLTTIVLRSARILDVGTMEAAARQIAQRSRGTPRVANRLLRRLRDYAQVRAAGHITPDVVSAGLEMLGVDTVGFDAMDRQLLLAILDKFDGGPVGIETLAAAIGEDAGTLEEVYEPYLLREGFINARRVGVTRRARHEHFGVAPPRRAARCSGADAASPDPERRGALGSAAVPREKQRRQRRILCRRRNRGGDLRVMGESWSGATDSAAGNVFLSSSSISTSFAIAAGFLVLRNVLRLYIDRRRHVPGSTAKPPGSRVRVHRRFPAAVMLLISLEFSTNAIDDWFNREVEDSLLGAWRLAQTYYHETGDRSQLHATRLAETIAPALPESGELDASTRTELLARIAKYQRDYGLGAVQLFDAGGAPVIAVRGERAPGAPSLGADADLFERARAGKPAIRVEPLGGTDVVRAAAVMRGADGTVRGILIADSIVDESARDGASARSPRFASTGKLKINKRLQESLRADDGARVARGRVFRDVARVSTSRAGSRSRSGTSRTRPAGLRRATGTSSLPMKEATKSARWSARSTR